MIEKEKFINISINWECLFGMIKNNEFKTVVSNDVKNEYRCIMTCPKKKRIVYICRVIKKETRKHRVYYRIEERVKYKNDEILNEKYDLDKPPMRISRFKAAYGDSNYGVPEVFKKTRKDHRPS